MNLKQNKVTSKAIKKLVSKCQFILDSQGITTGRAFDMKVGQIERISISGRSLRKIFIGQRVHINTITKVMDSVGIEWIITNGKIDIEDEQKENGISDRQG